VNVSVFPIRLEASLISHHTGRAHEISSSPSLHNQRTHDSLGQRRAQLPQCATHHKLGIQTYKGLASR
jgi:hypothetical protein